MCNWYGKFAAMQQNMAKHAWQSTIYLQRNLLNYSSTFRFPLDKELIFSAKGYSLYKRPAWTSILKGFTMTGPSECLQLPECEESMISSELNFFWTLSPSASLRIKAWWEGTGDSQSITYWQMNLLGSVLLLDFDIAKKVIWVAWQHEQLNVCCCVNWKINLASLF